MGEGDLPTSKEQLSTVLKMVLAQGCMAQLIK